jgi:major vault protein
LSRKIKETIGAHDTDMIRILPYQYIHILDNNSSIKKVEVGPQNYIREDHEGILTGPTPIKMVILSPFTYICIKNPIVMDNDDKPLLNKDKQYVYNIGQLDYRNYEDYKEPFPLYPDEQIHSDGVMPVEILTERDSYILEAIMSFEDENKQKYEAGDRWLIIGPNTYVPRQEVKKVSKQNAIIIEKGCGLLLECIKERISHDDNRKAGEKYIVKTPGFYHIKADEI